jgi:hypothetical protein
MGFSSHAARRLPLLPFPVRSEITPRPGGRGINAAFNFLRALLADLPVIRIGIHDMDTLGRRVERRA